MNTTPSTEDRVWAVISHLSSLLFGMGILLPIIGWADQRRKSNFASFQCLQALGYQSLGFTVWVLSYLVIVILASIILLIITSLGNGNAVSPLGTISFTVVLLGFLALYLVLPIIAAVACALGKDFRYPFMGDRLARYLEYDSDQKSEEHYSPAGVLRETRLNEDHEYRWVAAAGHFSVLIMLWGMLAPLTAWILHGRQNLFLKFQSIQTLVYQGIVTILYLTGIFMYSVGLFALIAFMGGVGLTNGNSSLGIAGIIIFGIILVIAALIILLIPLLHILGQWAGYRILKGDDYRYPLVGRLIERWMPTNS
jgi:uncharacterized Tic20 family protein